MSSLTIGHGTVVANRYELGSKICETSLGTLYKGIDRIDKKKVCVEILGAVGRGR